MSRFQHLIADAGSRPPVRRSDGPTCRRRSTPHVRDLDVLLAATATYRGCDLDKLLRFLRHVQRVGRAALGTSRCLPAPPRGPIGARYHAVQPLA